MTAGGEDNGMLCPLRLGVGNDDDETMARLQTAESCAERDAANQLLSEEEDLLICF